MAEVDTRGRFNPERLLEEYSNFIKAIQKKYNAYLSNPEDKAELHSQIQLEFLKLVEEYDTRRGVDFPGYIKMMLPQRVYHYVMKNVDFNKREVSCEEVYDVIPEAYDSDLEIELVEAIASLNSTAIIGSKRSRLLESLLIERKTLEEIAEEEGVEVKVIRLRFHFLCKKLYESAIGKKKQTGEYVDE